MCVCVDGERECVCHCSTVFDCSELFGVCVCLCVRQSIYRALGLFESVRHCIDPPIPRMVAHHGAGRRRAGER